MAEIEKAVARFRNGNVLKGMLKDFSIDSDLIILHEDTTQEERWIPMGELKAIFFVKSFAGTSQHVEKKAFGIRKVAGKKAFVKFDDRESLVGFIDGDIPWEKGFSLEKLGKNAKGFFLTPVDGDCNNIKIFVVGSAIKDITIMMARTAAG
jgi:hypothetical protein